ncbi:DUF2334 domain-containing protein [Thermococcus sp.]|uniref:DUF2334 domain-containing protein n=1 Tax=Thermococcus sp. TaxID=35749 RepID=UPI00262F94F7|nr:DUF2334 domain-containing protein [Thermococcus sp.]
MRKLSIVLVLATISLVYVSTSSLGEPAYLPEFGRFVILIHDVSPGYAEQLREITAIINGYNLQNRTYLFVIPDHGGGERLRDHPEFEALLENLSSEGYHIGLHGYDHIGREFDCSRGEAERRLDMGLRELGNAGFIPEYFLPPRYALSGEALRVLLSRNLTVIGEDFVYFPNGTAEPILNREYTWYLSRFLLNYRLESAQSSYENTRGTFFLSVHPKAVNSGAGLEFLREFLNYVRKTGLG